MEIFDAERTRAALPFERLIPALRALFASGRAVVPTRGVHAIADDDGAPAHDIARHAGLAAGRGVCGQGDQHRAGQRRSRPARPACERAAARCANRRAAGADRRRRDSPHVAPPRHRRWRRPGLRATMRATCSSSAAVAWRGCCRMRIERCAAIEQVSIWTRDPDAAQALASQWRADGHDAQAVTDLAAAAVSGRHRELRHLGAGTGRARPLAALPAATST